jgi:uncharacterized protein YoxC
MTPAMAWILVVLAAVLVAVLVAVLLQLRQTLKSAERTLETLETTGRHLNETLDGLTATLARVNRAMDQLELTAGHASTVLLSLRGVGEVVSRIRSSVGIVTSLGSAAVGAVMAAIGLRSRSKTEDEEVKTP